MFSLLSELRDFLNAVATDNIGEVWLQDDLLIRQMVPISSITSALTCTARRDDLVLVFRAEVETASIRTSTQGKEITDAVRGRLDRAMQLLVLGIREIAPDIALRKGLLLQPGMFVELATFRGEQHIWQIAQPGGLSTRTVERATGEVPQYEHTS